MTEEEEQNKCAESQIRIMNCLLVLTFRNESIIKLYCLRHFSIIHSSGKLNYLSVRSMNKERIPCPWNAEQLMMTEDEVATKSDMTHENP